MSPPTYYCHVSGCRGARLSSHNARLYRCPACGAFYRASTLALDPRIEDARRRVQREMEQRPTDHHRLAPPTYANYYALRGWPAPHLWLNDYLESHDAPLLVPYHEVYRVTEMLTRYITAHLPSDTQPGLMWRLRTRAYGGCTLRQVRPSAIADLWQRATDDVYDTQNEDRDHHGTDRDKAPGD